MESTARHIVIKKAKNSDKENFKRHKRKKNTITYKGNPIRQILGN